MPVGWFENDKLDGKITAGAMPAPVSDTVCGLPTALYELARDALRVPVAVGVKFTLIVQFAPAATLVPHVLNLRKSLPFVPPIATPVMFSAVD